MLEILYVEDNPADVFLLSTAIKKINSALVMTSVGDGEKAIDFLRNANGCPCVIVLDLGLPKVDGVEVFKAVKANPDFRGCPTVVFAERDGRARIERSGYLPEIVVPKPMDLDGYSTLAKQIIDLCESSAALSNSAD
jgi:CheY-like chemotaxis protein